MHANMMLPNVQIIEEEKVMPPSFNDMIYSGHLKLNTSVFGIVAPRL